MLYNVAHLFMYWFAVCESWFVEISFKIFCLFLDYCFTSSQIFWMPVVHQVCALCNVFTASGSSFHSVDNMISYDSSFKFEWHLLTEWLLSLIATLMLDMKLFAKPKLPNFLLCHLLEALYVCFTLKFMMFQDHFFKKMNTWVWVLCSICCASWKRTSKQAKKACSLSALLSALFLRNSIFHILLHITILCIFLSG